MQIQTGLGQSRLSFYCLRELHLLKGPCIEAIVSVVSSSDILEQHNIVKRR